jgi:hypothetical protein
MRSDALGDELIIRTELVDVIKGWQLGGEVSFIIPRLFVANLCNLSMNVEMFCNPAIRTHSRA